MNLDFSKNDGMIPVIIQDINTSKVLMLGYMNREALEKTKKTNKVTFYSRSREELWTKGETSGNELLVRGIISDCDDDTLLIKVVPTGPVCHTGADTCFDEKNETEKLFLTELERIISDRKENPVAGSYTNKLLNKGLNKITQKIGEEATEVIVAALSQNIADFKNECADLLYHLLVLLKEKKVTLQEIDAVLSERHKENRE